MRWVSAIGMGVFIFGLRAFFGDGWEIFVGVFAIALGLHAWHSAGHEADKQEASP